MSLEDLCIYGAVRILNVGGRTLRRVGLNTPGFDIDTLLRTARQRTGLDDFGAWRFDVPLERLLKAYCDEADLTPGGHLTVRRMLVTLLENLLKLEDERARTPAVEAQTIAAPVFIIGLPRTGTTLLHGVMSQDPSSRAPLTWEVMYPAAPAGSPDEQSAVRVLTRTNLAWVNRLAPEYKCIHPIGPDLPQECIAITAQVFMGIQFHTMHNVPSYQNWFERDSQRLAFDFHYRLLQHLQVKRPGPRWVLKAPGHLFSLTPLLKRYPDAKIVQTHRDPLRAMASIASLTTVLRGAFSDRVDPRVVGADWTERWGRALDEFLAVRDRAPATQFLDVAYEEIENTPLATVERIYDFLGWPLTDAARAAMARFLAANPKDKHGVHRYRSAKYGLDGNVELRRFRVYCERFGIAVQS
jgi:hypothetical protein